MYNNYSLIWKRIHIENYIGLWGNTKLYLVMHSFHNPPQFDFRVQILPELSSAQSSATSFIPLAVLLTLDFLFLAFLTIDYHAFLTFSTLQLSWQHTILTQLSPFSSLFWLIQILPRAWYETSTVLGPIEKKGMPHPWGESYDIDPGWWKSTRERDVSCKSHWVFMIKEGFLEDVMMYNVVCARHILFPKVALRPAAAWKSFETFPRQLSGLLLPPLFLTFSTLLKISRQVPSVLLTDDLTIQLQRNRSTVH